MGLEWDARKAIVKGARKQVKRKGSCTCLRASGAEIAAPGATAACTCLTLPPPTRANTAHTPNLRTPRGAGSMSVD